jgi:hypothetical protein
MDYHDHSSLSNLLGKDCHAEISESFCPAAEFLNKSSHPLRGFDEDVMSNPLLEGINSITPLSWYCSIKDLGILIPLELPIWIKLVFIASKVITL